MSNIFRCKTPEGNIMKSLFELLQSNIKTSCFRIDKKGIFLRMTDHGSPDQQKKFLIDLSLYNENFALYKFKAHQHMFIGVNQSYLYKLAKNIKKKDSITLFISNDKPSDLSIKITPKDKNRITVSTIKIQNIQNLEIDLPDGYDKPVIVPSAELQKILKEMSNIGSTITVVSKKYRIKFLCNAGSVYSREVVFGETESDDEESDDEEKETECSQEFDTEQLTRIAKIASLSNTMQIYQKDGLPILFRSAIGSLGKISIYVKSRSQLEEDERNSVKSDEEVEEEN